MSGHLAALPAYDHAAFWRVWERLGESAREDLRRGHAAHHLTLAEYIWRFYPDLWADIQAEAERG